MSRPLSQLFSSARVRVYSAYCVIIVSDGSDHFGLPSLYHFQSFYVMSLHLELPSDGS